MRIFILCLLFLSHNLTAQISDENLLGMWHVTKVQVGERTMTPVAKWTEFSANHRHRGGNGWMQHTLGNWELNAQNALLKIGNDNGIKDEYGPFQVSFSGETMHWERQEEGVNVRVTLEKISTLPQAHWDKAMGLWILESMEGDEMDGYFSPGKLCLHMGWDRRFFFRSKGFRSGGKWFANAHRPEIEFFAETEDQPMKAMVEFEAEKMILKFEQEKREATMVWRRISEFPQGE